MSTAPLRLFTVHESVERFPERVLTPPERTSIDPVIEAIVPERAF